MMKTIKLLFGVIFCILLVSCSDDDDFRFNKESLKQTVWEGRFIETNEDEVAIETKNVVFQFYTTEKGQYIINKEGYETVMWDFNYVIDERMINITNGSLLGNYTLLEFSQNKMILVILGTHKGTLTLNRKY